MNIIFNCIKVILRYYIILILTYLIYDNQLSKTLEIALSKICRVDVILYWCTCI